jgi:hypothetical protein
MVGSWGVGKVGGERNGACLHDFLTNVVIVVYISLRVRSSYEITTGAYGRPTGVVESTTVEICKC